MFVFLVALDAESVLECQTLNARTALLIVIYGSQMHGKDRQLLVIFIVQEQDIQAMLVSIIRHQEESAKTALDIVLGVKMEPTITTATLVLRVTT